MAYKECATKAEENEVFQDVAIVGLAFLAVKVPFLAMCVFVALVFKFCKNELRFG